MTENSAILTLVGEDKPGIVAAVSGALFRAGYSLAQASMMQLGANFAIMLRVSWQASDQAELHQVLAPVCQAFALHLHIDEDVSDESHSHNIEPNVQVTLYGADRNGLVAQLTEILARQGMNIIDLQTELAGTAQKPIYILTLEGVFGPLEQEGLEGLQQALAELDSEVQVHVDEINTLRG